MADDRDEPAGPEAAPHEVISLRGAAPPRPASAAGPSQPATEGQWAALRSLGRKQSGGDVPWINIADARALTEAGLAQRSREGWDITAAGVEILEEEARRTTGPPSELGAPGPGRR